MPSLKQFIEESLTDLPEKILSKALARKLDEAGITLPKKKINELARHILDGQKDPFIWDDAPESDDRTIKLDFSEDDTREIERTYNGVLTALPGVVEKSLLSSGKRMFEMLDERWDDEYVAQLFQTDHFRRPPAIE